MEIRTFTNVLIYPLTVSPVLKMRVRLPASGQPQLRDNLSFDIYKCSSACWAVMGAVPKT